MTSNDITIRFSQENEEHSINQVHTWLREHNWAANREFMERVTRPDHNIEKLILFAEVATEDGAGSRVVGGLIARIELLWLRISIMATDPDWRSQGVGSALLSEAERIALSHGCRYSYVDTMDYQAPDFYEARGYRCVGTIPDWDSCGHTKTFFVKEIGLG